MKNLLKEILDKKTKNGLSFKGITEPSYSYVIGDKKDNRFKYNKKNLVKIDNSLKDFSENNIMLANDFNKVYNSGNLIYVYEK